MRIGIEAQRLFRKEKHGMDYVVLNELRQLQQIDNDNEYCVFVKPGEDRCLTSKPNMQVIELKCPTYYLWEQWALPRAAKKAGVELLHCTSNTAPLFCSVPLMLTLHDVIFMRASGYSASLYQKLGNIYRRILVPWVVNKCRRIVTVSDFEKADIARTLNIPEEKITVLHNGYDDIFKPLSDKADVIKKHISQPGYFFVLGNSDGRKNIERMLIAYSMYLRQSEVKRDLLLTNLSKGHLDEIITRNGIQETASHIVLTGYVPIADLPYLYNGAFAFLFASLSEGFGIPIIESMACGTPVITSDTSSMPEVAGEEAILINPEVPEAITEQMLKLEQDNDFYKLQQEYGLRRAAMFSWREATAKLVSIYKDTL